MKGNGYFKSKVTLRDQFKRRKLNQLEQILNERKNSSKKYPSKKFQEIAFLSGTKVAIFIYRNTSTVDGRGEYGKIVDQIPKQNPPL